MSERDQAFVAAAAEWWTADREATAAEDQVRATRHRLDIAKRRLESAEKKLGEFVGRNLDRRVAVLNETAAVMVEHVSTPTSLPERVRVTVIVPAFPKKAAS